MLLELVTDVGVTSLLAFSLAVLVVTWVYTTWIRTNGLPPSPAIALPLIGHLHLLPSNPRKQIMEWGEKCGGVYSLYFGSELMVVLNGYDVLKEAFIKNAAVFSERPPMFVTQLLSKNKGFLTSDSHWKAQRRVSLEILRHLGLGTNVMESKVQNAITEFVQLVDAKKGEAFDPREYLLHSIGTIICALMYGEDYKLDNPEIASSTRMMGEQVSIVEGAMVLKFFPILQYLPGDLFGLQKAIAIRDHLEYNVFRKQMELKKEAMKDQDVAKEKITDFMTGYLRAIEEERKRGVENSDINEDNLIGVLTNLFAGGIETTSTSLCWGVLYLLHHPEVSDRCYKEIIEAVGPNERVTIADRQRLRYMEATTLEILRICDITPYAIHHAVSEDITFRGYRLPKGTVILPNLDSVQLSKEIWGDPHNFRPERFLDETGENIIRREDSIPFSVGKRTCPGESMAKMELFLFMATLIQKFNFRVKDGSPLPPLTDKFGLTCSPLPYEVCLVPR